MGKASAETNGQKTWDTKTQSGQSGFDPLTEQYRKQIFDAAQGAGHAVPNAVTGAMDYNTRTMGYGDQGQRALNGDPTAAAAYMNPYQQQVIDAQMKNFGLLNTGTMTAVGDAATKAGAFGGSRQGVAQGVALGENNRNQSTQIAGLLQSGFTDAMGRAASAAGAGQNAAGMNANLGMNGAGSPEAWRLMMLQRGLGAGPYGQTYTGTAGDTNTTLGYKGVLKAGLFG